MTWSPIWLAKLAYELYNIAYMIFRAKVAVRFWWYRRTGRAAEIWPEVNRMTTHWSRNLLDHFGCQVQVEGLENLPQDGGYVIASNHQSMYDIAVLNAYLPQSMGFVTKKELFRVPGLSFWMRGINCLPLDRKNVAKGGQVLHELAEQLKRDKTGFILFPEGTRTRDPAGAIGEFRRGSLRMATDHGLPVVPISLDGGRLMARPDTFIATRHGGRVIRMRIAPPMLPEPGMSAPQRRDFVDRLRATIVENFGEIRVTWPGEASA